MREVISKTIKIKVSNLPPTTSFIEGEFKKMNLDVIRWAIVDVIKDELILSISAFDC